METGQLVDFLANWIRNQVEAAGARGGIVGISGGVDSAVVAGLTKRALGEKSLGIIMPCQSDPRDIEDAEKVARHFGLRAVKVPLDGVYHLLVATLREAKVAGGEDNLALANLKPRLRMLTLYYYANMLNYLVIGTGNRSEIYVGYFTKYGDGGVDIEPIGNLRKSEVRKVALELGVPEEIIAKPPSAGLWENQTDEGEMGVTYEELDRFLEGYEVTSEARSTILRLHNLSKHKRAMPPIPPLVTGTRP